MIELAPKQKWAYHRCKSRLNILEGSVRSGKTVALNYKFIQALANETGKLPSDAIDVIVGKTLDSLKRNIINPMLDLLGSSAQYFPGKRELHIFDKVVYTIGANDERSEGKIRGSTIRKALGDELTLWPESFFKMLDTRLSMDASEFFGSTNPDNPNHYLKREYLDKAGLDLFRGRFRLDDNPFLPKGYIEALKRNFTGLWYRRFVMGEWCVAEGAIYDFFERTAPYVLPRAMLPIALSRVVGVDYGTNNPTAFLLFGRNHTTKPEIWCEDEYFYDSVKMMKQKTDAEYASDFFDFIGSRQVDLVIVDPSAASFKLALKAEARERDTFIRIKDADNDVISGIRTQASMLRSGAYAICEACQNTLREYEGYVWDKKSQLLGVDAPVKKDDHTKDPERYVLHTLFAKTLIDYSRFTKR